MSSRVGSIVTIGLQDIVKSLEEATNPYILYYNPTAPNLIAQLIELVTLELFFRNLKTSDIFIYHQTAFLEQPILRCETFFIIRLPSFFLCIICTTNLNNQNLGHIDQDLSTSS